MKSTMRHLPASSTLSALLLLSAFLTIPSLAQKSKMTAATTLTTLPMGTTLPVQINHAFCAGSVKPGTTIIAVTTQRIPISPKLYLNGGAHIIGTVITSTHSNKAAAQPATLTIRFTTIRYRHQAIPIATRAIAIANFTDVDDTALPANGSTDRGNPNSASWTTRQIGGDEVSRSGWIGPVVDSTMHTVGFADYFGVYADPPAQSSASPAIPHAIGVFSTTARGLYGFDEGAALSSAYGEITITSPHNLILRNGDNLLLQIIDPTPNRPATSAITGQRINPSPIALN